MNIIKVTTILLLAIAVGADKKIELQDIEEDNLRSEKEKEYEKSDDGTPTSGPSAGPGDASSYLTLDYIKNGLLKYLDGTTPVQQTQQQRFVHQYAVTEPPERPVTVQPKPQYAAPQHPMLGYLSNMPMQIYLVPQYYQEQPEQSQSQVPYPTGVARVSAYQPGLEQQNFVEVPAYPAQPVAKSYVQHYQQPLAYVAYAPQPTVAPASATVAPVVAYPVPVVQYTPNIVTPSGPPAYYHQPHQVHVDTNSVDDVHDDSHKHYAPQQDYQKSTTSEFPRYYNSRAPIREEFRHHHAVPELPIPHSLLIKPAPPHLSHIPKTLPMFRPVSKVYQSGPVHNSPFRPHEAYGPPAPVFKKRPSSLLDSYVPSSLQVDYLRRGLFKDPLTAYDALSSGRVPQIVPRHYERGFLPNQMYHTAAGGVTYGHYKRTPKSDKVQQK